MHRLLPLPFLLFLTTACSGPDPVDETHEGTLSDADQRHHSDGSFYDEYEIEAGEGYRIVVTMESAELDPFLHVFGPEDSPDQQWQNDDRAGDDRSARIEETAPVSGTYTIWANSHREGETGSYRLRIQTERPAGG